MNDMTITTGTDLAVIKTLTPAILFQPGKVDEILSGIEAEARKVGKDASTAQSRDAIRSMAYKVSRSKTALDKMGKDLTEQWRTQTNSVNAERRTIVARLDALAEEVRKPLTDYENAEKERVAGHEAALATIAESPGYGETESAADLEQRLDYLSNFPTRDWQEFTARAKLAVTAEVDRTAGLLLRARKREAEAAELERLRAEETERMRLERLAEQRRREEQIAAEAAERATREAEEAAERKAEEVRRAAQAALDAAEQQRLAAAAEAERRQDAAIEAERQRAAKEQQRADYHRSMLQHVKNCGFGFIGPDPQPLRILQYELTDKIKYDEENFGDLLAEALVARDAALAMIQKSVDESNRRHAEEAERARVARETEAQRKRDEERAANKAHQAKINNEVLDGLMDAICEVHSGNAVEANAICRAIIVAVAKGQVKHMRVEY